MTTKTYIMLITFLFCLSYSFAQTNPPLNTDIIKLTDSNFVTVRGEINGQLASTVITELMEVEDNTIYVYLSTPGGSIIDGMKIIQTLSALERSGKTIVCLADVALSMGFVILQYCPERIIMQSSVVMQHQSSLQVHGPLNNINSYMSIIHSIGDDIDEHQANRLELKVDDFRNKVNNDWWLFGSNILKNKVADRLAWITCDFDTTVTETKIYTFFGPVTLYFSKCPLASEPLKVVFDDNFPMEEREEVLQKYSINKILEDKFGIKRV